MVWRIFDCYRAIKRISTKQKINHFWLRKKSLIFILAFWDEHFKSDVLDLRISDLEDREEKKTECFFDWWYRRIPNNFKNVYFLNQKDQNSFGKCFFTYLSNFPDSPNKKSSKNKYRHKNIFPFSQSDFNQKHVSQFALTKLFFLFVNIVNFQRKAISKRKNNCFANFPSNRNGFMIAKIINFSLECVIARERGF